MTEILRYGYIFWGSGMPRLRAYDPTGRCSIWNFKEEDNAKFRFRCLRVQDSESELQDGSIRQRIKGYRFIAEIKIEMLWNMPLLTFLARLPNATKIILVPHEREMLNPNDLTDEFSMLWDGDFEPEYLRDAFLGHSISFALKSRELLKDLPLHSGNNSIIPAQQETIGGATQANQQSSLTYPNEKLIYGGWELSAEDYSYVAFCELAPEGEADPRGI